jgi:hypothetical protein
VATNGLASGEYQAASQGSPPATNGAASGEHQTLSAATNGGVTGEHQMLSTATNGTAAGEYQASAVSAPLNDDKAETKDAGSWDFDDFEDF